MELSEKCPSNERLSSLLAGELEPAAVQETLVHLDTCTVCQRRIEEISGCDERLLQMLNEIGGVESSSSELQRALCELKGKTTSPPTDPVLPFMNPPNSSGCLGQIGPYEILDVIGQGGMGIVLKARDASLNRLDAIKVLMPQHASNANARRRFLREARAAAAISHENVVTVYAVDEFHGYPFLVMEYVCGCSLEGRMRGQLNCQEVLRVGAQIAAGLAAAHACGVIHRDIKPANILLRADDGRVKITDFGLARVADGMHVTQSGLIAGTPAYMSPEQTRGQLLDGRSDLFSLGCVLHAMVTGRSPFQAKTVIDTIRRVCDETPPSVRQFNADISDRLAAIIERLMAKDPDARFQSATELAVLLQECTGPPLKPSATDLPSIPKGSAINTLATTGQFAPPPRSEHIVGIDKPSIAVLPFENMSSDSENEYFSDGLAEELINMLTRLEGLSVAARTSAFQFKGRPLDVRDVGRRLNVNTILEGSVRRAGKRIRISAQLIDVHTGYHVWSEQFNRDMVDIFAVQDDIARKIVSELRVKLVDRGEPTLVKRYTCNVDAYSRYLRGRFYWNKREPMALRRAIEYYDQALAIDPDYAVAHAGKADCNVLLATYALIDQQQALESSKRSATRALTLDDTLSEAHKSMGFVLACCDHDWSRAERHFRRALELDPRSAGARLAYALSVLVPRGRFAEALGQTKRARDLDPVTPMIVAGPGVVQTYNRQYSHAIDAFAEALELEPLNPVVNLWSAIAWLGKGEFAQALAVIEIARPFQLLAKETEAVIHASAGRCNRAEELLAELRNDVECGCREATLSVGRVYAAIGRKNVALDWLERAVQQRIVATILLAVDPCYDGLRGERHFGALLRQLDLED